MLYINIEKQKIPTKTITKINKITLTVIHKKQKLILHTPIIHHFCMTITPTVDNPTHSIPEIQIKRKGRKNRKAIIIIKIHNSTPTKITPFKASPSNFFFSTLPFREKTDNAHILP
jgi:hypothetical protein